MLLSELLRAAGVRGIMEVPCQKADINAVTRDSREVTPGALFVALPGTKEDGAKYIEEARTRGAAAVLSGKDVAEDAAATRQGHCLVRVDNPRLALARIAAAFYAPQPKCIVAITGTDGKTSTADFVRQLAAGLGKKSAAIGTLGVTGAGDLGEFPALNTTPDPVALHRALQRLAKSGVTHVAMEASSHGLDQYRLDGVRLNAGAFTNLTRDHLDYHLTDEAYFKAKRRLFADLLPQGAPAVLNADDLHFQALVATCASRGCPVIDYGKKAQALQLLETMPIANGQQVRFAVGSQLAEVALPLYGAFQAMNMLAAFGLMLALGEKASELLPLLEKLKGPRGRLEKIGTDSSGAAVFIDYAHTPAALANVLKSLRPYVGPSGRLSVVFGCGGDRDAGKRPEMGRIASELADNVFVTDDNPRGEDPAAIRASVVAGAQGKVHDVAGREVAITAAVSQLKTGDVLVIAGKGHETTQIIGAKTLPFDDAAVAREAMAMQQGGDAA